MTLKDFIKKLLTNACIYFTAIMVIYIAIAAIVNVNDDALLLDAGRTVLFFVFSLLVAFANSVFTFEKLSGALKILIHYVITVFAFYSCFLLSLSARASVVLVGIVIFSVIYFIIAGIIALFKARYRTKLEDAQIYEKQYKPKR